MFDSIEQPTAVNKRPLRLLPERWGTTLKSHFFREKNLAAIAEQITKKETGQEGIRILSVGCSVGFEAQELALRLLNNGVTDFQIDGIDISDAALTIAQKNEVEIGHYGNKENDDFFKTMAEKGFIALDGKAINPEDALWTEGNTRSIFSLSEQVKSKLSFLKHDIINGPLETDKQYDIVICNNVLIHYRDWERNLILTHSLANLKDKGVLGIESSVWTSFDSSENVRNWVRKYFKWINRSFSRFGLKPEESKIPDDDKPVTLWRYNRAENKHSPKNFKAKAARAVNATLLRLNKFKIPRITS